jgi:hypothetical protein
MTDVLLITGDIAKARITEVGRDYIVAVRRAVVVGGRPLLALVKHKDFRGGVEVFGETFGIRLVVEIEHRIRTSGGQLSEEEMRAALGQLRESQEDVNRRYYVELSRAYAEGASYAVETMRWAVKEADERALSKSWEMGRKAIGLRQRLNEIEAKGHDV